MKRGSWITRFNAPIDDKSEMGDFAINTNPNNGTFDIYSVSKEVHLKDITLYSIEGKVMYQKNFNNSENIAKISISLKAGLYIYIINSTDNKISTGKLLIQ